MKRMQKNRKISTIKLIFFCIITAIVVVNLSVAKYKNTIAGIDSVQLAVMAQDTDIDFSDEIQGHPGCDPKIYEIRLTNKENDKICEVKQKYKIKIEREEITNLPIELALYKDANCTQILSTDENGYYDEEDFSFNAGIEQTKTLYLKIVWPEARKNVAYAFEIDSFKLHIISTQID